MKTYNAANERIKRDYFEYLKEAKRAGEASIDGVAKALNRFESYTRFRDFKQFHRNQAIAFKQHLAAQTSIRTGDKLSKATLYSTLMALRHFVLWLAGRPGFRSRVTYADADYFNLSEKESRIAKARRPLRTPTVEQIQHVLRHMPHGSEIERRDRALIAFTLLTGARDGATVSFKLKHIDLAEGLVEHDAREVKSKFSKTFNTLFFPVPADVRAIVVDWVEYLRCRMLWGHDDPLFPRTRVTVGAGRQFKVVGLEREHWSSAAAVRKVFKRAFAAAGLPYFNPHSFRRTLVAVGNRWCRTPEEFKSWSQNLGHECVMTTFNSYGEVAAGRQAEIMRGFATPPKHDAA
jgi:integrase